MPVCINNYIVNSENGVFNRPMGDSIRVKKIKLVALRSVYVFINCSLLQSLVSFYRLKLYLKGHYVVFMF